MFTPMLDVEPQTKFTAWFLVVYSVVAVIFMQAVYAGMFSYGAYELLQPNIVGDELFVLIFFAIFGLATTVAWPLMIKSFVWSQILEAWNFEKI